MTDDTTDPADEVDDTGDADGEDAGGFLDGVSDSVDAYRQRLFGVAADPDPADVVGESTARGRMAVAVREVREEVVKAALLYAVVDAAVVFLAVNLVLYATGNSGLGPRALAALLALTVLAGETWLRTRGPLVERFEAENPDVWEALRTARDAIRDGADSRMATRLYEDVLERLRAASSAGLVDDRRVGATLVVVVLLSAATVQVAAVGIPLGGDAVDGGDDNETVTEEPPGFDGLQNPGAVLGEPEEIQRGEDNLTAEIETTGGDGPGEDEEFPSTGPSGGDGDVETQQAGYEPPGQLENAELIREYNLRIREDTE